jgi:arylsulfatase A-like enzyme
MKNVLFATVPGFVAGMVAGLLESLFILPQLSHWHLQIPGVAAAMLVYGLIGMVAAWVMSAFIGPNAPPEDAMVKAGLCSFLSLMYVIAGYPISAKYLPEIRKPESILFIALWTLLWGTLTVRVLRKGGIPRTGLLAGIASRQNLIGLGMGLVLTALFSVIFPLFGESRPGEERTARQDSFPPNLVLIVMDTTRADRLSPYRYARPTTPYLDQMARDGIVFEQCHAAAPWTFPSHASLFTGLHLAQHKVDWPHRRLDDRFVTLAELTRNRGYETAGFSNNAWISRALNFHQGFDDFEESWDRERLTAKLAVRSIPAKVARMLGGSFAHSADLTNRDIRRWLDHIRNPNRPFFIFINYMEPHFVYEPPQPYRDRFLRASYRHAEETFGRPFPKLISLPPPMRFTETQIGFLSDLYDGEIAYLDSKIGEFMRDLAQRKLLENTLVIVLADHGDSIGEHDLFQHQYSVYETLLHVPLIMRYPRKLGMGRRIADPVSLIDIVPTAIELLGFDARELESTLPGKSLLGMMESGRPADRSILAEYTAPAHRLEKLRARNQPAEERYYTRNLRAWYRGRFKFIWASDGEHELYDLEEDPRELRNLIAERPQLARAMEKSLHRYLARLHYSYGSLEEVSPLDEAHLERLRGLGYLQ